MVGSRPERPAARRTTVSPRSVARARWLSEVRAQTAHFVTHSIAYNRPEDLKLYQSQEMWLIIESESTTKALKALQRIPGDPGPTARATIEAYDSVEATLSSSDPSMKVERVRPAEAGQTVTPLANAEWVWRITPTKPGSANLRLEIRAHYRPDGQDKYITTKIYDDRFEVAATRPGLARYYAGLTWHYVSEINPILAGLLLLVGSLGAILKWFPKSLGGIRQLLGRRTPS